MTKNKLGYRYTWRGPAPSSVTDAYLLAMVLRTYNSIINGVKFDFQPSVLTKNNVKTVAVVVFTFKKRFEELVKKPLTVVAMEKNVLPLEDMADIDVSAIKKQHKKEIADLERELRKYIGTDTKRGFICYGG